MLLLTCGGLIFTSGMDWSVESAEDSSKEAAEERADEVGVEVVSQVSALVLHNLCLEDGQAEGDGRVEGSGVVVSDLDEAAKGQGHGEGDQDAVLEGPVSCPFNIKITATKMKVHTTCVMKVYQFSLKPSESVAIS